MKRAFRFRLVCVFPLMGVLPGSGCAQDGPSPVSDVSGVKNLSRDGDIYVAGTPTPEGLEALKARGVKTIIDLRQPQEGTAEESEAANALDLRYINIPMRSDELTEAQANALMDAMNQAGDEPVLLHCAGASRAGAAYGLFLGRSGKCAPDDAVQKARAAGMRNEKLKTDLESRLTEASQDN